MSVFWCDVHQRIEHVTARCLGAKLITPLEPTQATHGPDCWRLHHACAVAKIEASCGITTPADLAVATPLKGNREALVTAMIAYRGDAAMLYYEQLADLLTGLRSGPVLPIAEVLAASIHPDTARLGWMEALKVEVFYSVEDEGFPKWSVHPAEHASATGNTLRAAIDAAREEQL